MDESGKRSGERANAFAENTEGARGMRTPSNALRPDGLGKI
jgi:hypothetical protein